MLHAVGASLASKGASSLLQFVSMPVAARVLGKEEFGIYATIFAFLYLLEILQIGVGPALAREIAEASAQSDRPRQSRLYITGAILVIGLAIFGLFVGGAIITWVPVEVLFGAEYAKWETVLIPALWTGLTLLVLELIVRHTDRVREGYLETGIATAWVALGNLLGALAVLIGIQISPSPSTILIAVFLPNIIVRIVNTVLLLKKRPWLVRPLNLPGWEHLRAMLKDGAFFAATNTFVQLVEFKICALLVGRILGPSSVAIHFVLMMIITAFTGMLIMVGNPLWAAIVDAKTKGDIDWLDSTVRKFYLYLGVLCVATAIGLIAFGPWLIPTLFGASFQLDRPLLMAHVFFLAALGWRRVNRFLAIGLGLLPQTVKPILIGLAISLTCGIAGLSQFGLWALYIGLGIGIFLFPGVSLPMLVHRDLRDLRR